MILLRLYMFSTSFANLDDSVAPERERRCSIVLKYLPTYLHVQKAPM